MKVKVESIVNGMEALAELAKKELRVQTSYKVARLIKACNAEMQTYNEQRIGILKALGCGTDETGANYIIPDGKKGEFTQKYMELISTEVEIAADKIDLSDETAPIAPGLLLALEDFIILE